MAHEECHLTLPSEGVSEGFRLSSLEKHLFLGLPVWGTRAEKRGLNRACYLGFMKLTEENIPRERFMERSQGLVRAHTTYLFLQFFQVSLLDLQLILQFSDSLQHIKFCIRKSKFSRFKSYSLLFIWCSVKQRLIGKDPDARND